MEDFILSIIIVNYNTEQHLRDCLLSINKFPPSVGRYEIIVTDNGSKDGSLELLSRDFPDVKIIANDENFGFAKASNQGIRISKGKYVFLLNTDTELIPNTFDLMINYMEKDKKIGALSPMLLNRDGSIQPTARPLPTRIDLALGRRSLLMIFPYFRKRSAELRIISDKPIETDIVSGGAMLLRKETLDKVGLLDERFFLYMEDIDLCRRIKESGWKVLYNPDIKIIHHWEGTSSKFRKKAFLKHHISIYQYFQKYEPGFVKNLPLAIALIGHYLIWLVYSFFEKNPTAKTIKNGEWVK